MSKRVASPEHLDNDGTKCELNTLEALDEQYGADPP